jgi:hypothetical protein
MAKDKKSKSEGKKARLAEKKQKQEKKGEQKDKARNAKVNEYVALCMADTEPVFSALSRDPAAEYR